MIDMSDSKISMKTGPKVPLLPIPRVNDYMQSEASLSDDYQSNNNVNNKHNFNQMKETDSDLQLPKPNQFMTKNKTSAGLGAKKPV